MRAIVIIALLAGCAETPPQFVPPGSTAAAEQRKADAQCEAWLAEGVDSGEEPALVLTSHGIHRDKTHRALKASGAICAFEWKYNECRCFVQHFGSRGVDGSPGWLTDWYYFSACHELHTRGEI